MIDETASLHAAIQSVHAGRWAVGVSGGADSIALLHLLHARPDLQLVVAHLNHQTRGPESDGDADFTLAVCNELKVAVTVSYRDKLEASAKKLPANASARYRALRFKLFKTVIKWNECDGVIFAHHADDQAETVLQRLLRGAGYSSLAGIASHATVHGIQVVRPLLNIRRAALRKFLCDSKLPWREDSSNASPTYLRNRLRAALKGRDDVVDALLDLSRTCSGLKRWTNHYAPRLDAQFPARQLEEPPAILARHAAAQWLRTQNVPAELIDRTVVDRLRTMCTDAASAAQQQFPGGVRVRRRAGIISAE